MFDVFNFEIEEVWQVCFVFDVVKFEKGKSRSIASFWMLSSSNIEDASQNSFVFKLAGRQINRQIDK